jgi:hypothetical protein
VIPELRIACNVCESGAVIERYKHIIFAEGTLRAFNGVVSVQAPSTLDPAEKFAVNEERLLQALSACDGDDVEIKTNADFLILKRGKLTVRVRKLSAEDMFHDAILPVPKAKANQDSQDPPGGAREASPFMSSDATRPWTTSVLLRDGFMWATNNLSLVKYPLDLPCDGWVIPDAAVPILLSLPDIDWLSMSDKHHIVAGWGKLKVSFPQSSAKWPDNLADYFKKAPKKLPILEPEIRAAAKFVDKFAERFVALKPQKVEGKLPTIESEYEIEVPNGKGLYPAKLLLLVLNHCTHADFSTYPEPVFFAGAKLRGVAVGAKE